jgi:hypothetical protein
MKKIFFFGLTLNLFLSIITQNYCFSHPFLNSDYYYRGDINSSLRLPNRLDALESSKEKSNYSVLEKPALHAGLLIVDHSLSLLRFLNEFDDFDKVDPISKSENLSKLSSLEFKNDEGDFVLGEKITLTAEPNPGFKFVNWTVDGKVVSKDLTYILIIPSKNISIKANFEKVSEVTPDLASRTSLLEGLVAFYEMNTNLSGILKDSHGQNNGTSTQISQVNGYNENGNRYDGRSSISRVPHSNSLNLSTEFTLMADIFRQANGQASSSIILGKTFSATWTGNQTYSMAITKDNKIRIRTNSPDLKDWVSTQTVPLGTWVRVIATYKSGEGYSLFMDTTEPEKSPQFSGTIAKSDLELTIGSASLTNNAADNRRFEGILDNVGMWNRQLSKDEIARLITTKITYPDFADVQQTAAIRIVSPVQNSQFEELSDIEIKIESDDNGAKIQKVELFNDTTLITTLDALTFNYTWKSVPVGQYSIKAKVFNGDGSFAESAPVAINVIAKPNVAPSVSLTAPAADAQFTQGDNVSITATAADSDGTISKVEFFNGSTLLGTDTTSPYSFAWTTAPLGSSSLTAKATDDKGAETVSTSVTIKVITAEVTPDPGSGTSLLEGLVAFYEMNTNLSGVLKDSHGQNNGTSTQISQVNGYNENGNRYDGISSVSSVPHSSILNLSTEFTWMADIFRQGNGQASSSIILGKTFSATWPENQTYSMAITSDNKIRIRTNSPDLKDWVSTQTVPLGKWIRVIATYKSGEGYSLFMDTTEPEKSPQFSGTIAKSDLELTIGSASLTNNAAYNRRFEGILDNVGMWSRQLSKDEIARLITTKITYPDFKGNETYRITMSTSKEETIGKITTTSDLTKAEVGEKIIFLAENEENMVFDHWSLDGVEVGNQTLFELDMPKKDISLTKHFRTLVGPEIRIRLPSEKSDFEAMSEVHIEFEIKSNDATIEKVELFNGNELVAELTQDFSGIDWKNIPEGNHELVARITDTNSQSYFSEAVILKVVDNQAKDTPNVLLEYIIGPNPTLEYLNVIFTNLDGIYDFEFRVVSMNGVVEKSFRARPEDSAVTIDVSDLDMGVYVLHLIGNGHNLSSRKFIKE